MRLNELFESPKKELVSFCFGRMNPPTLGHKEVFDTLKRQGGDYFIYLSKTQDKKENPLSHDEKVKFVKLIHPEHASHVVEDRSINTVVVAATDLYNKGYKNAVFVAGSDRIDSMSKLLTQYNGVEGKGHVYYKFDSLEFVSSGEREDGAQGVKGISASRAREKAANGDLEGFAEATGAGQYSEELYNAVRKGLGINESIEEGCKYGRYYCSTDKKWKCRTGPKQSRKSK